MSRAARLGAFILATLAILAIGVFIIERDFMKASAFAFAGAVMTYFGFMHGEAVGIGGGLGVTPGVALAYAVVAAGLYALGKTSPSVGYSSHPEMSAAVPAETTAPPRIRRRFQVRRRRYAARRKYSPAAGRC